MWKVYFLDVNQCITTKDDFGFVTEDFAKPVSEGRQFIIGKSYYPKTTFKSILFGEALILWAQPTKQNSKPPKLKYEALQISGIFAKF